MKISLENLSSLLQEEFPDIIEEIAYPTENKLRIILTDNTFVDVFLSEKLSGVFSFHLERRHKDGTLYRYDNYPDPQWKRLATFPYHFHKGKQGKVVESPFRKRLPGALVDFMEFVRSIMTK